MPDDSQVTLTMPNSLVPHPDLLDKLKHRIDTDRLVIDAPADFNGLTNLSALLDSVIRNLR